MSTTSLTIPVGLPHILWSSSCAKQQIESFQTYLAMMRRTVHPTLTSNFDTNIQTKILAATSFSSPVVCFFAFILNADMGIVCIAGNIWYHNMTTSFNSFVCYGKKLEKAWYAQTKDSNHIIRFCPSFLIWRACPSFSQSFLPIQQSWNWIYLILASTRFLEQKFPVSILTRDSTEIRSIQRHCNKASIFFFVKSPYFQSYNSIRKKCKTIISINSKKVSKCVPVLVVFQTCIFFIKSRKVWHLINIISFLMLVDFLCNCVGVNSYPPNMSVL